jgi:two-component system LytT family response regulator
MRCLILDDEAPAREGLRKLLLAHPDVEIVAEAADVESALRSVEFHRPEVAFVDVQLRGETGFDFLRRVPDSAPQVVFVTAHDRFAARAFRVEALDYLLKPVDPVQLDEALRRVRERLGNPAPRPASGGPEALQPLGLTARQAEVLFWIAHGKTNPEIAAILANAPETVKKQVQAILDRLGVGSRLEAALIASRWLGLG